MVRATAAVAYDSEFAEIGIEIFVVIIGTTNARLGRRLHKLCAVNSLLLVKTFLSQRNCIRGITDSTRRASEVLIQQPLKY